MKSTVTLSRFVEIAGEAAIRLGMPETAERISKFGSGYVPEQDETLEPGSCFLLICEIEEQFGPNVFTSPLHVESCTLGRLFADV